MKKFNFRLEKIRRYKEQLEEDKKMKLAAERARLYAEREKLTAIIEVHNRYFEQYGQERKGKLNIQLLVLTKRYLDKLSRDIRDQEKTIAEVENDVQVAQQELIEATKEKKKYEKLKEKYKANYYKEMIKEESQELDEFGMRENVVTQALAS